MKIRKAKKSDYKELMKLYNLFMKAANYGSKGNDSFTKIIANKNATILVAEENKQLMGFITLFKRYVIRYSKPFVQVEELFVLENYRKQGIGKKLLSEAEKLAKKLKCWRVYVESRKDLIPAHKFYGALGYKKGGYYFVKKLSN